MGWKADVRAMEAADRRRQREAQRRQRELEMRAKERAKLSELEQSRLEVETHENQLEVLLSVHKEQGKQWDWAALAVALPPPCPHQNSYHERRAKQRVAVMTAATKESSEALIRQARLQDEEAFEAARLAYAKDLAEWEAMRALARRILAGEAKAYTEALVDLSPLVEISDLGSSMNFTVHHAGLLECVLKVNGKQVIPAEVKTLTASGKVSIRAMPKGRFHEIYQDYLCGCLLRVAREVFALLPVEMVLLTAVADTFDSRTGQMVEQPVLSVAMPRDTLGRLDFDRLDPSDAMENFLHRGDFKASRKAEAFQPIKPLVPSDIPRVRDEDMGIGDLVTKTQTLREELRRAITELAGQTGATLSLDDHPL